MRSSVSLELRIVFLATTLVVLISDRSAGQTARVQFINASTYEEADTIDVYLNGRLLLDDLAFQTGTPFRDYATSLAFGTGPRDQKSVFLISGDMFATPTGSGPAVTQVGVGTPGATVGQ